MANQLFDWHRKWSENMATKFAKAGVFVLLGIFITFHSRYFFLIFRADLVSSFRTFL